MVNFNTPIRQIDSSTDLYSRPSTVYKQPISKFAADPVQCAIDGWIGHEANNLFSCPRNVTTVPIGFNRAFMAQRCAANWDGYCDMYGEQESKADYTNNKFTMFIRECLIKMFCQNDKIPGSQCIERCEMYDPMSTNSVSVCQTQGDVVFRGSLKVSAQTTDFPQLGRLQTTEPVRFTSCPKVCNLLTKESLSDDNVPLNIALDQGIAMDVIQDLVINIVSQQKQSMVSNGRLKNFMNKYVMNGSVKPGFASVGATGLIYAGDYVDSQDGSPALSAEKDLKQPPAIPMSVPAVTVQVPKGKDIIVNQQEYRRGPMFVDANPQGKKSKSKSSLKSVEKFAADKPSDSSKSNAGTIAVLVVVAVLAVCSILFFINRFNKNKGLSFPVAELMLSVVLLGALGYLIYCYTSSKTPKTPKTPEVSAAIVSEPYVSDDLPDGVYQIKNKDGNVLASNIIDTVMCNDFLIGQPTSSDSSLDWKLKRVASGIYILYKDGEQECLYTHPGDEVRSYNIPGTNCDKQNLCGLETPDYRGELDPSSLRTYFMMLKDKDGKYAIKSMKNDKYLEMKNTLSFQNTPTEYSMFTITPTMSLKK